MQGSLADPRLPKGADFIFSFLRPPNHEKTLNPEPQALSSRRGPISGLELACPGFQETGNLALALTLPSGRTV